MAHQPGIRAAHVTDQEPDQECDAQRRRHQQDHRQKAETDQRLAPHHGRDYSLGAACAAVHPQYFQVAQRQDRLGVIHLDQTVGAFGRPIARHRAIRDFDFPAIFFDGFLYGFQRAALGLGQRLGQVTGHNRVELRELIHHPHAIALVLADDVVLEIVDDSAIAEIAAQGAYPDALLLGVLGVILPALRDIVELCAGLRAEV
ncbi:hypothetical protein [Roseovarius ramblicola]|uniref:Uncharacterized protein n=1 Tax=Roseovarius ramblicola TaxID=2022336 RepID=A0ABV5HX41_9RHOB